MKGTHVAIAAGCAAALGAIAATIWVGVSVREDTVVAHPYEDGLRQDAERHARAALGLEVSIPALPEVGAAPLAFELKDRAGRPVDDAAVTVWLTRAETSHGGRSAHARCLGAGRWTVDLPFPEAGTWDLRFDVVRGNDRVRLERRVAVEAPCDLGARACTARLDDATEVALELGPRPIRTMRELAVRVRVRSPSPTSTPTPTPPPTATATATSVSFSMPGMTMGENRAKLAMTAPGTYEGKAVLVRCASGRRDWVAEVELATPGRPARTARFALNVPEESR